MTARTTGSGEAMGSMYVQIGLTNDGPEPCSLIGYAGITAYGGPAGGQPGNSQSTRLRIIEQHGGTYRSDDPGAHQIVLAPGAKGTFDVSSVESYQGGKFLISIQRLVITLPGGTGEIAVAMPSPNGLTASAPSGEPIPLTVSAVSAQE